MVITTSPYLAEYLLDAKLTLMTYAPSVSMRYLLPPGPIRFMMNESSPVPV